MDFRTELTRILLVEKSDPEKVSSIILLHETMVSKAKEEVLKGKLGQYDDLIKELQKQVDRLKTII